MIRCNLFSYVGNRTLSILGVNKVFAPLIEDLKILEQRGVVTSDGIVLKGSFVAIAGDKLDPILLGDSWITSAGLLIFVATVRCVDMIS